MKRIVKRCKAKTAKGQQCKKNAINNSQYCSIHQASNNKLGFRKAYYLLVGNEGWKREIILTIQSIVTVLAIIIAGIWFLVSNEGARKVNISHSINTYLITDNWRWVGAKIKISNAGKIALRLNNGTIWIQKILPIPIDIKELIDADKNPIPPGEREVQWNVIGEPRKEKLAVTILPEENDELEYDFIIPSKIKVIKLYSHFSKQGNNGEGWQHTSVFDLRTFDNEVGKK